MGKHSTSERFGPAVFLLVGALPGGLGFFSFQTSQGGQGQFTGHEVDQLVTRHMNPGREISRDHQGQLGAIPTVPKLRMLAKHTLVSSEVQLCSLFRNVIIIYISKKYVVETATTITKKELHLSVSRFVSSQKKSVHF